MMNDRTLLIPWEVTVREIVVPAATAPIKIVKKALRKVKKNIIELTQK